MRNANCDTESLVMISGYMKRECAQNDFLIKTEISSSCTRALRPVANTCTRLIPAKRSLNFHPSRAIYLCFSRAVLFSSAIKLALAFSRRSNYFLCVFSIFSASLSRYFETCIAIFRFAKIKELQSGAQNM